ncbi:peptidase U32 family protein [Methanohalophilus sp.]|uniref:peptidase U32 family protein n=1 Tax=Methanohalophilus sp. TaxID=1966352 RepID=UPI002638E464|nr:peptidase U32 family protein [Methanohalophilus sp.]
MIPEPKHYPELVAGVKNLSSLNACQDYVDAVYFSLDKLSLRSRARAITTDNLSDFVNTIHNAGLKGYLAVNSVIYPKDMNVLREVMDSVKFAGVDAVICWDPAAISEAVDRELRVHISTQANVSNWKSAEVYRSLGAERVVLSRELSLDQIREIREHTDIELEVFVHGAMCQAISGRCYLSAYLLDRSANCGDCAQPCRWEWSMVSDDGSTVKVGGRYLLSAKDLCMIEHIPKLVDVGVDAFKLEGRLRDSRYTSTVSKCYSMALSSVKKGTFTKEVAQEWKQELGSVFNRGFSTGFYFGTPSREGFMHDRDMNASTTMKQAVGVVSNYYSKKSAAALNLYESSLSIGDKIIIEGNSTYLEQEVKSLVLDGSSVQTADKGEIVGLAVKGKVRKNDRVSKIVSQ